MPSNSPGDKNTPQSRLSIAQLKSIHERVYTKLKVKYPQLESKDEFSLPGGMELWLHAGGATAFFYRDRYIVLVDRGYLAPKEGRGSGDSVKKQVRVWDIFQTLYNPNISILSFLSGDEKELTKLFTYKVFFTGGFNKYNPFKNSIWVAEEHDDAVIEATLTKAILDGIAKVDELLGAESRKVSEEDEGATITG